MITSCFFVFSIFLFFDDLSPYRPFSSDRTAYSFFRPPCLDFFVLTLIEQIACHSRKLLPFIAFHHDINTLQSIIRLPRIGSYPSKTGRK